MTAQLTIDQTTGFLALPEGDEIAAASTAVIARDVIPDPAAIADEVLLYLYSDQNPDNAQKNSRIYARLNDAFYGMIMPRDFAAGQAGQAAGILSGVTLPDDSTEGNLYIYNDPAEQASRLFVRFTQGWTGLLMPSDFS